MATYLQIHILDGETPEGKKIDEDFVLEDGENEHFFITENFTPFKVIVEFNRGLDTEEPACIEELKKLLLIKKAKMESLFELFLAVKLNKMGFLDRYEIVFAVNNPKLTDKICNIVAECYESGPKWPKIIDPEELREFLGSHMGKKLFLLEV